MTRLQSRIVSRGYITTRVLAATQDLTRGVLTLSVIPGRIRDIRAADGTELHVSLGAALPAASGDLLNLRDIEQGLENLKRVPTADADVQIAPAADPLAGPGESDLVVVWQQQGRCASTCPSTTAAPGPPAVSLAAPPCRSTTPSV
jgi:hemolysin activation/secretion protein